MNNVLAIVPARSGSKGIPNKNWRPLAGMTPYERAFHAAVDAGVKTIITTTDWVIAKRIWVRPIEAPITSRWIQRPAELAADDTPMLAVIQHALDICQGADDDKIVLLQPTAVLREPKHITQALALLTPDVDSVVSVVELPRTHNADVQLYVANGLLGRVAESWVNRRHYCLGAMPPRRQDLEPLYIRDGTCYAFHRRTVTDHGDIYGDRVKPLIIPADETCPLDSMDDWREAERRLRERQAHHS